MWKTKKQIGRDWLNEYAKIGCVLRPTLIPIVISKCLWQFIYNINI